ncbi:MAG: Hsp20/alpha crystallin family protein [Gammaproteobacteria bacterium]|nr:MAG: Hsp20/alpha crystallin family protein [Gammaproteobacteria bacterium]
MEQKLTQATAQALAPETEGLEQTRPRRVYRPLADIYETDSGIVLSLEMPGVPADGVEVTLEKRVLTIRGRAGVKRPETYRQIYAEYGEGDYERSFTLSADIDAERINAVCRHGVLTLELPKAEEAKPRQINVRAA